MQISCETVAEPIEAITDTDSLIPPISRTPTESHFALHNEPAQDEAFASTVFAFPPTPPLPLPVSSQSSLGLQSTLRTTKV